ncbi:hypothetical protein [Saccharopolyspora cebuensis]|uniref:Uncharacterized protein n=1 Tax=Saccharopolyspora cebuensis TaxID=418759 RepID=A0ABV4CSL5_9PSEU
MIDYTPWRPVDAENASERWTVRHTPDQQQPIYRVETELVLSSADCALQFTAALVVEGASEQEPPPASLLQIAREGIWRRAEDISRERKLTEAERLLGQLNEVLIPWQPISNTLVQARAHCHSVDADPGLVAAVAARDEAIKQELIDAWKHDRRSMGERRMQVLLTDPLQATAWWFVDNPDKTDQLPHVAERFRSLRALLAPEQQDSAGRLLNELWEELNDGARAHAERVLSTLFDQYGRRDLGARLHRLGATAPAEVERSEVPG